MSASTPENKVKRKIDALLKPYKVDGQLWYSKTAGSMFGTNGVPDYVCCILPYELGRSKFFTIEAKAGKGKPTALQEAQMRAIRRAGGITLVINENNLDELRDFLHANS